MEAMGKKGAGKIAAHGQMPMGISPSIRFSPPTAFLLFHSCQMAGGPLDSRKQDQPKKLRLVLV